MLEYFSIGIASYPRRYESSLKQTSRPTEIPFKDQQMTFYKNIYKHFCSHLKASPFYMKQKKKCKGSTCQAIKRKGEALVKHTPYSAEAKVRLELHLYRLLGLRGLFQGEMYTFSYFLPFSIYRSWKAAGKFKYRKAVSKFPYFFLFLQVPNDQSQGPRRLRRRSEAACLLGIENTSPTGESFVSLLRLLCVVRESCLRRADHSSRGILQSVVCLTECDVISPTVRRSRPRMAVEPWKEKEKIPK